MLQFPKNHSEAIVPIETTNCSGFKLHIRQGMQGKRDSCRNFRPVINLTTDRRQ